MQLDAFNKDTVFVPGEPVLGHRRGDGFELAGEKPMDTVVNEDAVDMSFRNGFGPI